MVETRRDKKRKGGGDDSSALCQSGETADLINTVRALQEEMRAMQRKIGTLETKVEYLEEEKKHADGRIEWLEKEQGELDSKVSTLDVDVYGLKLDVKGLESTVEDLEKEVERVEERAEKNLDALEKEVERVEDRADKNLEEVDERASKNLDVVDDRLCRNLDEVEEHLLEGFELRAKKLPLIESALKYHRNLIRNQNWTSRVPRLPSQYWIDNGCGEATAWVLSEMADRIASETRDLRLDGADGYVHLSVPMTPGANALIPHNDAMLPLWKEFTLALDDYRHFVHQSGLDGVDPSLTIGGLELTHQVLNLMEPALNGNPFKRVELCFNNGGRDLIAFAAKVLLTGNESLRKLDFEGNPIQDEHELNLLLGAVSNHPSLLGLSLASSCRRLPYQTITSVLSRCNNMREIDLSNNGIATAGNSFLEGFLESNEYLTILRLENNRLEDADAHAIARGLHSNKTLIALHLEGNNFTDGGLVSLMAAVYNPSTLNTVSGSNHTCLIHTDTSATMRFNASSKECYNRRRKIYFSLSNRNKQSSNVSELGDDFNPSIIPSLVRSVQEYSVVDADAVSGESLDVVPPLSIVFELLRGWVSPRIIAAKHS